MRNRPAPSFVGSDSSRGGRAWDVDADPALRLTWLFGLMVLPLLVVTGRLVQLQWVRSEQFALSEQPDAVSFEPILARNGRILAADGTVLAYDDERFRVLAHYRWLEDPPNDDWLRATAASRLSRVERKEASKLAEAKQQVLAQRELLWQSLASLTDLTSDQLAQRRRRIQERVERIKRSIEERAELPPSAELETTKSEPTPDSGLVPLGRKAWNTVVQELTTSPTRDRKDPLRIPEQSDYHVLLDDVPFDVVGEIESRPERFPGLRTDVAAWRVYPVGRLAPHLLGFRGEVEADELRARREQFPHGDPLDYQAGDTIGRAGIEQSYEHILRGVRGQQKVLRDRHGTVVRKEVIRAARPGRDVVLSLDTALQQQAQTLLDETVEQAAANVAANENEDSETPTPPVTARRPLGGCLVAIDVHTGAILAAVSAPTFDINDFLGGDTDARRQLEADARRPMFPRVTQMAIPPGSVFKAVSAVAFLQSGIDPDRTIECIGHLDPNQPNKYRCYHSHAHYDTDLTKALAVSCNVYFYKGARAIGAEPLVHWAEQFGFGLPTGLDVAGEVGGNLPRPPEKISNSLAKSKTRQPGTVRLTGHERLAVGGADAMRAASPWEDDVANPQTTPSRSNGRTKVWNPGDTLGLAIGQFELTVTPLQIARMMAAVANDGWLVTPHLATQTVAPPQTFTNDELASDQSLPAKPTSSPNPLPAPRRRIPGLSESTLSRVREGLEQVVAAHGVYKGTAYETVRLKEIAIAGKTGTAEIGRGRPDHAWFAGYVPADRPQVAFVVVLEQAGSGGKVAGPVAKKFVQTLLDQGLVRPR